MGPPEPLSARSRSARWRVRPPDRGARPLCPSPHCEGPSPRCVEWTVTWNVTLPERCFEWRPGEGGLGRLDLARRPAIERWDRVRVKLAKPLHAGGTHRGRILRGSMTSEPTKPTIPAPGPAAARRGGAPRRGYEKDRAQLLRRLARIEGQVRGITRMVERDEYCIDIMQQTAALRAAVDAVTLLLMEDHVAGCLAGAFKPRDSAALTEEVMEVVRRTMGRPVRAARAAAD